MIIVLARFVSSVKDKGMPTRVDYTKKFDECPWPRLPVAGDTVYMNAHDLYTDADVPVEEVRFNPVNGHVMVILREEAYFDGDLEACGYELTDIGFQESSDPYVDFERI